MLNWIKNIFKSVCTAKNKIAVTPVKTIDYLLNDPTTPEQGVKIVPPTASSLKLNVQGYVGGGYAMHTLQGQAASCYVTIQNTAKYLISQNKTKKTFTKWAATSTLNVLPRAGKDFNAYYDRSNLKFFYDIDTVTKKTVYTAESADIVSHEFGHAFLDILRPDLWNAQSYEAWAFHESFGDISAISNIMQYDQILQKALTQTNNDLSKSNIISRLAEELGKAIFDVTGDKTYQYFLRDAVNDFIYVDPKKLPKDSPNDQLSNEPHSFSRVWTGTWYECMIEIFKQNMSSGMQPLPALKSARDTAVTYILYACQFADTIKFYNSAALQMLNYDKSQNNSKYGSVLRKVFIKRNIIGTTLQALSNKTYKSIVKENKREVQEITCDDGFVLKTQSASIVKIKKEVSILSNKKDMTVEVPCRNMYMFDKDKNLIHAIETSEEEVNEMANSCVNSLSENNLIGEDDSHMFEVINNKLLRKKIVCKCNPNNACDPNAPEYGKPWKGQNNAGCGSKGVTVDCSCSPQEEPVAVKRGCYTSSTICSKICRTIGSLISRKVC
jgi:hypothetical protein